MEGVAMFKYYMQSFGLCLIDSIVAILKFLFWFYVIIFSIEGFGKMLLSIPNIKFYLEVAQTFLILACMLIILLFTCKLCIKKIKERAISIKDKKSITSN